MRRLGVRAWDGTTSSSVNKADHILCYPQIAKWLWACNEFEFRGIQREEMDDPTNIERTRNGRRQYSTPEDFCKLFAEEVDSLYQLAFLLTGNKELSEQSFVSGLQCCQNNMVFVEWARAWAKRTIIENAVRALQSCLAATNSPACQLAAPTTILGDCLDVDLVLALPPLERLVFVLSVLERYSDQDCASFLQFTQEEIRNARVCALERLRDSCAVNSEAVKR
jgi:DNA-directed RNA polymerase specialized sigma24 family protein